jgi:predicted 2-oxoglutarate/Fe(II)-dependent dioxygenase YbiX
VKNFIKEYRKVIPNNFCKKIISYFDSDLEDAATVGGVNKNIRNCVKVSLLHPKSLGQRIISNYAKSIIENIAKEYSKEFKHCFTQKISQLDLLKYETNKHDVGYSWHVDMGYKAEARTLSMSICLNNDFKGGEFVFDLLENQEQFPQNTGDAIVFPSNFIYPHQVNKVTEGTRYALIGWVI